MLAIVSVIMMASMIGFIWGQSARVSSQPGVFESRITVGLVDVEEGDRRSRDRIRKILSHNHDFDCELVSPSEIRAGHAWRFDVLVFPGGKASMQSKALGADGREAVRAYLRSGGGYVGICAGAFLASSGRDWSLNLLDAATLTGVKEISGWGALSVEPRRSGTVDLGLTDVGKRLWPGVAKSSEIEYSGGPIFSPAHRSDLPDYEALAVYRSEVWSFPFQKGTMIGTPAIIAGSFGQGRVVAISPHPEISPDQEILVSESVAYAANRTGHVTLMPK
jgi:glutamine amidotransferase-like uncharacterized protein